MPHTNAPPTSEGEPRKSSLSLAARPIFASQRSSSSLLFVDETAPKSEVERRKIRAHVSLTTHEAKRRHGLRGPREGSRRGSPSENVAAESPLQDAPFINADPFDSLPVKKFPGMHDIIGYYLDHYPGVTPLADDQLLRNKSTKAVAKRSNTQWDLITSHKTCLLLFLSELLRLRSSMHPYPKWLYDYLRIHHQTLQSIRENLPIHSTANLPSPGYIFAVLGLGSGQAAFLNIRESAVSHLNGGRRLVSLRGGIDTVTGFARRVIVWAELYVCAAFWMRPTLYPVPSPWLSQMTACSPACPPSCLPPSTPHQSSNPFPPAFTSLIAATHVRIARHLTPHPLGRSRETGEDAQPMDFHRIFPALTLVSAATADSWRAVLQVGSGGDSSYGATTREAVAVVLDDVAFTLHVELARLRCGGDDVGGAGAGEVEHGCGGSDVDADADPDPDYDDSDANDAGRRWARAVMLHAAHAYLWAQLSALPAHAQMNVTLLKRLRRAIEAGAGVGAWVLSMEALMWALVVGWFLAERAAGKTLLGQVGEADAMLGWFEDRILALLDVERGSYGREDRAAVEIIADFPATDEFRRKWCGLLLQDKFSRWR